MNLPTPHLRLGTAACSILLAAIPALAQPRTGSAELPVRRIVLFTSGVGYFQRDGQVDGNSRIDLRFATNNINDLLKSMVLQDQGGGQISTASQADFDPYEPEIRLVVPEKATERSRDFYRFQARAEINKPLKLDIVQEEKERHQTELTNITVDEVRIFIQDAGTSRTVKKALEEIVRMRERLAATQQESRREEELLKTIEQDQSRMRENMKALPQTSETYKHYLKKLDDQEAEIEKTRTRLAKLKPEEDEQKKAYDAFLIGLNLE